jgi:hypothetical protein
LEVIRKNLDPKVVRYITFIEKDILARYNDAAMQTELVEA